MERTQSSAGHRNKTSIGVVLLFITVKTGAKLPQLWGEMTIICTWQVFVSFFKKVYVKTKHLLLQ